MFFYRFWLLLKIRVCRFWMLMNSQTLCTISTQEPCATEMEQQLIFCSPRCWLSTLLMLIQNFQVWKKKNTEITSNFGRFIFNFRPIVISLVWLVSLFNMYFFCLSIVISHFSGKGVLWQFTTSNFFLLQKDHITKKINQMFHKLCKYHLKSQFYDCLKKCVVVCLTITAKISSKWLCTRHL